MSLAVLVQAQQTRYSAFTNFPHEVFGCAFSPFVRSNLIGQLTAGCTKVCCCTSPPESVATPPFIRSYRGTNVVWSDFQPMRVPVEPVCHDLFRQNPVFTSLHLKSPVRVVQPLMSLPVIVFISSLLPYFSISDTAFHRKMSLPVLLRCMLATLFMYLIGEFTRSRLLPVDNPSALLVDNSC